MVEFCSKCGAILMGKKGEDIKCSGCGTSQKAKTEVKLKEKIAKKKEAEIIDTSSTEAEINPITDIDCPECKHNKAYYWTKQTRAGDEPETQFYKCEKCKHQWREYR